ncbi:LutB family protein [Niabella hibiscisoli]|uniref:hypothetical protein n=1 Tax=Niabella hibiscisoli TaxID=1825928 RepID=UPI001F116250|nr:hypothetical protein [Niabella hibiscisoli]MCH5715296.1 hypothetical protein [Niabella hibiscisoli]
MKEWKHLSHASSLCGNCTEVCAVKINLHELLLENRHEAQQEGYAPFTETVAWKMWKTAMLKRSWMNMGNGNMKTKLINSVAGAWTKERSKLEFPKNLLMSCGQSGEKEKAINTKRPVFETGLSLTPTLFSTRRTILPQVVCIQSLQMRRSSFAF